MFPWKMMELILIKNAWGNLPQVFKVKGCEEMIYECWYTIQDKNGIDLIYYSQISSIKNEFSTSYSSVPELKKAMESRFSKLLRKGVTIELNTKEQNNVTFDIFFNGIPILEKCCNFIYLGDARDAIHRIERYKIQSLESVIHNKRLYYKVAIQDKVLMILKYPDIFQGYATPKRNFEVVTDDLISRITMEIAKIMVKMGDLDAGGS